MTQCKQLSLFDYNAPASAAAAKRANTASGSSLRCSKILREPFLIVKNQVGPKFFLCFAQIFSCFTPSVEACTRWLCHPGYTNVCEEISSTWDKPSTTIRTSNLILSAKQSLPENICVAYKQQTIKSSRFSPLCDLVLNHAESEISINPTILQN